MVFRKVLEIGKEEKQGRTYFSLFASSLTETRTFFVLRIIITPLSNMYKITFMNQTYLNSELYSKGTNNKNELAKKQMLIEIKA